MTKQYTSVAEMMVSTLDSDQLISLINVSIYRIRDLEDKIETLANDIAVIRPENGWGIGIGIDAIWALGFKAARSEISEWIRDL